MKYNDETKTLSFKIDEDSLKIIKSSGIKDKDARLNEIIKECFIDKGELEQPSVPYSVEQQIQNRLKTLPTNTYDFILYMALKDFIKSPMYKKYVLGEEIDPVVLDPIINDHKKEVYRENSDLVENDYETITETSQTGFIIEEF